MAELLWINWYGNHCKHKDIKKITSSQVNRNKDKTKEIQKSWDALQGIIGGIK